MLRILVLTILFFSTGPCLAGEWVSLKRMDIFVETPDQWRIKTDLMGFPLVLLSETVNSQRASLSFTPSAHKGFEAATLQDIKSQFSMYQAGRKRWLNDRKAELLEFHSPRELKTRHQNVTIFSVGLDYRLLDKNYSEYSFTIICNNRFIFSKLLYAQDEHPQAKNLSEEVLQNFQCRGEK